MKVVKNGTRPILRGILALNAVVALVLFAFPQKPQAQGQNLLRNSGFEDGWYDVSGTQQAPNEWKMHWTEGEPMGDASNVTARPESRVLPRTQVPPEEHSIFFWDGDYTLKIFWAKAPIHVAISQAVSGLEVGREYRLVVPVFVDTFNWDGEKVPPDDPFSAQVRLGAGPVGANWQDESAINFSNWANPTNTTPFYLARNTLQFRFVATQPDMTVFIEYASKWGLDNNGIFMDALRLEPLEMAEPPTATPLPPPPTATPGPSPTPLPTPTPRPDGSIVHVVQSGETLTSIALRYDVSVDEIRQLNAGSIGPNSLIRVGQELVISVPSEAPTSTPLPQPPTATPQPEVAEGPSSTPAPEGASVCVLAFNDRNGNTVRDPDTEGLLPNVKFTLARASGVVAQYTSDGVNEPYCFTGLDPGSYRVIQQAPAGYEPTGLPEQNVALAEGTSFDLQFGNTRTTTEGESEGVDVEATDTTSSGDESRSDTNGNNLLGNILTNVARVAGVLVLILAGAIAVLFFLTRRRRY
jgi:hypothetical protein